MQLCLLAMLCLMYELPSCSSQRPAKGQFITRGKRLKKNYGDNNFDPYKGRELSKQFDTAPSAQLYIKPYDRKATGRQRTGPTLDVTMANLKKLTTGLTISVKHYCDNLALYCLRAYQTGRVCARTEKYEYKTFRNYCMMDYVNCCIMYEVFQAAYMGECYTPKLNQQDVPYVFDSATFLEETYWDDAIDFKDIFQ